MNKKLNGLIILALTVLLGGCTAESAELDESVVRTAVSVEEVSKGNISETYYGIGQLSANEEFEIYTGQEGTIEAIEVKIGDTVKKDQILFQLDNYKLSNQVQAQESQLRAGRASAQIQLRDIQKKYDQTRILYDAGAVSQFDMDQITDRLNQAEINNSNTSNLYTTNMKVLNDDLSDTYIKSPINGTIAAVYIEEGEEVERITAMKVINTDAMKAVVNVPEKAVRNIKLGQKAEVWYGGDKGNVLWGEVTKIDLTTQQTMSLYPVEITVENTEGSLLSGMFIEAEIHLQEKNNAVVIEKSFVLNDGQNDFVFIAVGDASKKTIIEKGIESGNRLEVLSGIVQGNLVVVRGQEYLENGDLIEIAE